MNLLLTTQALLLTEWHTGRGHRLRQVSTVAMSWRTRRLISVRKHNRIDRVSVVRVSLRVSFLDGGLFNRHKMSRSRQIAGAWLAPGATLLSVCASTGLSRAFSRPPQSNFMFYQLIINARTIRVTMPGDSFPMLQLVGRGVHAHEDLDEP